MKISDFWALYDKFGWFAVILTIGYFIYFLFVKGIDSDGPHRERLRGWLANDSLGQGYRRFLIGGLYKLASLIGDQDQLFPHTDPQEEDLQLPSRQYQKAQRQGIIDKLFHIPINPWTKKSFFFCLRIAFFLPIIAFVWGWVCGAAGEVGNTTLLPQATIGQRFLFIVLFFFICLSFFQRKKHPDRSPLLISATSAFAGAYIGAVGGTFIGAFIGAVAFAGASTSVFIVGVSATIAGGLSGTSADTNAMIVLFLVILPLLNAPINWLSLGLTRGLLQTIGKKRLPEKRILCWSLVDLAIAIILTVAVSAILVTGIAFFDQFVLKFSNSAIVDLPQRLAELRRNPWSIDHFWFYSLVLPSIQPILMHAIIALMALISWLPSQYRHWMTDPEYFIEDRDRRLATKFWFLIVPPFSFIIAPALFIYGLYLLLSWHGDLLGLGILNMLDGIAGFFV